MATKTRPPRIDYTTDDRADERLSPAELAKLDQAQAALGESELNAGDRAKLDQIEAGLKDDGFDLDNSQFDKQKKQETSTNAAQTLANLENEFNYPDAQAQQENKASSRSRNFMKKLKKNKGASIAVVLILGAFGIAAPFTVNLFKLSSLIEPIIGKVSKVPEHAVEQRFEYIVTRWLSMRIMKEAYPGDKNLVFCAGGGLLCHLGSTKYSDWFTKQLDAKFEKEGRKIKTTLNATGKSSLGGKATSFTVSLENIGKDVSSLTRNVSKELSGHKEARRFVNNMVKQAHGKNYVLRYISKKILMRKYGIKRFNIIPDKTAKNLTEVSAKIKASIIKGLVGRVSTRMTAYIGCLQGANVATCKQLLDKLDFDIDKRIKEAEDAVNSSKEGSEERKRAEAQLKKAQGSKASLESAKSVINGEVDGSLGKVISKELIKKVLGPIAVVGWIDMAFRAVGAIDGRVLEAIFYDAMTQAVTAFAFNEDSSPMVAADQIKDGSADMNTLAVASKMFDGAERSPLFQLFQLPSTEAASPILASLSKGITRKCTNEAGEEVDTKLPPGESICPENKMVRDFTTIKNNSWWRGLASVAGFWNSSIGQAFKALDDITSTITGPLWDLVKHLPGVSFGVEKLQQLVQWMIGQIIPLPSLGVGASGVSNYEALAAALHSTSNESMAHGQNKDNPSGKTDGAGGAALSDQQLASIVQHKNRQEKEEFDAQPMLAKLFNPSLQGSIANQLLAKIPTNGSSALRFLLNTPSTIVNSTTKKAKAGTADIHTLKAFGIPNYGYADSSTFSADPGTYTQEYCTASAKAREDSLSLEDGELLHTYKKTDPCALEKVVGGLLATAADDKESNLYIEEAGNKKDEQSSGQSGSNDSGNLSGAPSRDGWVWPMNQKVDPGPCWGRNVGSLGVHAGMDMNSTVVQNVYAAHDGEVVWAKNYGAGGNAVRIKTPEGIYYTYQHLTSYSVSAGQSVKAGQVVGVGGLTGRLFVGGATKVHLHMVVSRSDDHPSYGSLKNSFNPMDVLPKEAPNNYKCT